MASNQKQWLALVIMVLAGCKGASLEGKTACHDQSDCLSGYACIDDECVATAEGCDAFCVNACTAASSCGIELGPSCSDDCIVDLGAADCGRLEPLDRLPCGQLEHAVECASYCQAVCERGAQCATIDVELCTLGCVADEPQICNVLSVEPRSCDQIKVEARLYDNSGRALVEGGETGFSSGGQAFGLCTDPEECEAPLGCSAETNTCGACVSDAECDTGFGAVACMPDGCTTVECVDDDDCSNGVCDATAHVCRDCREDSDCTSGACDIPNQTCVECKTDAQCNPQLFAACDPEVMRCVQCLTDEHCAHGALGDVEPACDTAAQRCVVCTDDRHCTDPATPACDKESAFPFCVGCTNNEHCTDPLTSKCETQTQQCWSCSTDADCAHLPATPVCNLELGGCRP